MSNVLGFYGSSVHVCIDMQRLFAEVTAWHTPALEGIIPNVAALARAAPNQTLWARFNVPPHADAATGRWRHYYRRWAEVTGDRLDPILLDLVEPLAGLAHPGTIFDKTGYSIFDTPAFVARLQAEAVDTIVFSGVETDVCVLASVFDAIDRGYRVVIPVDAVASSSPDSHRAVVDTLLPRLAEQVDLVRTSDVVAAWGGASGKHD
ncbi:cysteine hydrolase [Lichenihabitans sp. PAMC28606]|uniref:cysteine hydrolase n=1 Tax=Lichenihabitans sp. PAMC28606 TaxID=2880932 RepID=UPI001D0B5F99|nr:cysteine hydrolase [Lichenihabitans sp. PAMC28606]UDL96023.1 cysteine hydrolase [Lichenihabitans sp. PAMC28606]